MNYPNSIDFKDTIFNQRNNTIFMTELLPVELWFIIYKAEHKLQYKEVLDELKYIYNYTNEANIDIINYEQKHNFYEMYGNPILWTCCNSIKYLNELEELNSEEDNYEWICKYGYN